MEYKIGDKIKLDNKYEWNTEFFNIYKNSIFTVLSVTKAHVIVKLPFDHTHYTHWYKGKKIEFWKTKIKHFASVNLPDELFKM